jgi:hypothetical protein
VEEEKEIEMYENQIEIILEIFSMHIASVCGVESIGNQVFGKKNLIV